MILSGTHCSRLAYSLSQTSLFISVCDCGFAHVEPHTHHESREAKQPERQPTSLLQRFLSTDWHTTTDWPHHTHHIISILLSIHNSLFNTSDIAAKILLLSCIHNSLFNTSYLADKMLLLSCIYISITLCSTHQIKMLLLSCIHNSLLNTSDLAAKMLLLSCIHNSVFNIRSCY